MARLAAILVLFAVLASAQRVRVLFAGKPKPAAIDMEEYVAMALAGEAGGFTSLEARRAMAIVARTYARYNLGRHSRQGYDFCETTHCQDLRAGAVTTAMRKAAADTEGLILWANGRPALVFYTEHCGGMTENARVLWRGSGRPYLRGVQDDFCLSAGRDEWAAKLALSRLEGIFQAPGLQSVRVLERSGSGRVKTLALDTKHVDAERFYLLVGRRLGWGAVQSKLFSVQTLDPGTIRLEGWGRGHGVGLCQRGTEERGKAGHTAEQILSAYFPGTRVGDTARDIGWRAMHGERADVWGSGAPEEESVPGYADRAAGQAEKLTGLTFTARPRVRIYPTVAAFREATAEPGFIGASVKGKTIRIQPPAMLKEQNRLGSTLVHEMLHLLLQAPAAARQPRWFEEGLVAWLLDPSAKAAALDARTESRLLKPRSEAELRLGYENSAAHVALLASKFGKARLIEWAQRGLPTELRGQ
jgi:stage II sporulation protein D